MCTQKDKKSKRQKEEEKDKKTKRIKNKETKREFIIGQVKIGRKEQLFAHLWTISIDRLCIICDL